MRPLIRKRKVARYTVSWRVMDKEFPGWRDALLKLMRLTYMDPTDGSWVSLDRDTGDVHFTGVSAFADPGR